MATRNIVKRKRKKLKTLFGVFSFISFFLMLGTVGAIETNIMPLGQGAFRAFLFLVLFAVFAHLGGAFE